MQRHFEKRKQQLLADCKVSVKVFAKVTDRLDEFATPFVSNLWRPEQRQHAQTYLEGLMSDLDQKNSESIAYRHDQDRQGLQHFIGSSSWDHRPLIEELVRQIATELGEADGVLVFDPSGFPKQGRDSVGVKLRWIGRLGKVDNGQVGIYMGYVSRKEHALVDMRLYLPEEWAKDLKRRKKCGVPREIRYQTRHELALEMLSEHGPRLPHAWVTGDDEMGRPQWFREALQEKGERYLLAVPSNTLIRDLDGKKPDYGGRGRKPERRFERAEKWRGALAEKAWTQVTVRDGEKGPLSLEIVTCRVVAKTEKRRVGAPELLILTRTKQEGGTFKQDSYLSNAPADTPLEELARVVKAEHEIEECLERAKNESGLADYQVRTWPGWYHHQTLSLMAVWFLIQETLRGQQSTPALTLPQVREGLAVILHEASGCAALDRIARERTRRLQRNEMARFYHWKKHNLLAPLRI